MKKYLILWGCILSVQLSSSTRSLDPYPHSQLEALGFAPYPFHEQQIVDVYLVDEDTWQKRLCEAKNIFDQTKKKEETEGYSIEILREYWNLSILYDYALANRELRHIFLGNKEGMEYLNNVNWAIKLNSIHPTHPYNMTLRREGYLYDPNLWREKALALTLGRNGAHSDHSDYTTPHDGASSSRPSTVESHPSSGDHTSEDETKSLLNPAANRPSDDHVQPYQPKIKKGGLRRRNVDPQ